MPELTPGPFEYELKQALGACGDNKGAMTAIVQGLPEKELPAAVFKELTVQLPTDDIASTGIQDIWNATTFNPFAFSAPSPTAGIIDAGDNTTTPGGQLGCAMCIMGIGFEMMGEPEVWTLPGWSHLSANITAGTESALAPDAATGADVVAVAAANGALGLGAVAAILDYGTPTWRFCENYIRAVNFVWRGGNAVKLINVPAEDMASCGPQGGPRGLSRADVATPLFVDRVNDYYAGLTGFANRTFYPQNAVRDGFDTVTGISTYLPDRGGDFAKVAFGSERRASKLYCNPCKQFFQNPLYLRDGLAIQIYLQKTQGNEYMARALENLGSSFNRQMTQVDGNTWAFVPPAGATTPFNEWDGRAPAPAVVNQTVPLGRMVYKWGQVRMRICLYGALLIDDALRQMVEGIKMSSSAMAGANGGWNGVALRNGAPQYLGGVIDSETVSK